MKSEEERIYDRAVELSEVLQEKNLYKTALYLACNGQEYLVNDFLQKARV